MHTAAPGPFHGPFRGPRSIPWSIPRPRRTPRPRDDAAAPPLRSPPAAILRRRHAAAAATWTGPAGPGPSGGAHGRRRSPVFEIDLEQAAVAAEEALDVLLPDMIAQAANVDARHVRGGGREKGRERKGEEEEEEGEGKETEKERERRNESAGGVRCGGAAGPLRTAGPGAPQWRPPPAAAFIARGGALTSPRRRACSGGGG